MSRKAKRQEPRHKVTWAEATQNIVIRSLDRGQFGLVAVTGLLGLIVWRLDEQHLNDLAVYIVDHLASGELMGWFFFALLLVSCVVISFIARSKVRREEHRIGIEKTRLQKQIHRKPLGSSRK